MAEAANAKTAEMISEIDRLNFSTGRNVNANRGILGIDDQGYVTEGYDGSLCGPDGEMGGAGVLSPQERIEMADWAIAQWSAFRERAVAALKDA